MNICSLVEVVVTLHVSAPYKKTAFMLVLILILFWRDCALEFQTDHRVLNACLVLLIRFLRSSSAPPSLTDLLFFISQEYEALALKDCTDWRLLHIYL